MKPYCVECPQVIFVAVAPIVVIGSVWYLLTELSVVAGIWLVCYFIVVFFTKRWRRILFGREFMTVVFSVVVMFFISRICASKEPWCELPMCEEDEALLIDDCCCRDPGGEGVIYSAFAAMFAVFAMMPWLPAGSRYYASLKAKENAEIAEKIETEESLKVCRISPGGANN